MKKALVVTFVLVLGLGFAAFADGALSGVWDTDVSLYPAASVFGDFIKSFTSKVDVDYTIGGFTFGMESTFGVLGLTGVDFDADGTLGAFTFGFDIDFSPMILTKELTSITTAAGGAIASTLLYSTVTCATQTYSAISWSSFTKTVSKTYVAGFDDLTADVSVSIAGVNLGGLLFLEGKDSEASIEYTTWYATTFPSAAVNVVQSGTVTVADPTAQGAGYKLTGSGTFNGATLTGRGYFNLSERSYNTNMAIYGYSTYVADTFKKAGVYSLTCDDCISRFTSAELILEDVSFACTEISAGVYFNCCGFSSVKFLLEDIGLGCCWDLGFDLLITFTDTSKSLKIDPQITFANACFTIEAGILLNDTLVSSTSETDLRITGVDIYALGLTYTWNGITFTSWTSFDIATHPILSSAYYGGIVSGPSKISLWQPDLDKVTATFTYDEENDTCTVSGVSGAISTTGLGYYELTSIACEQAKAWEMFKIEVDGDSCCGGAFDISAAFYFGDLEYLSDLDGWYYVDLNGDGDYADTNEYFKFYGDAAAPDSVDTITSWSAGCNCCPCDDCSQEVNAIDWDENWTAVSNTNRLFDWLETDVDVVIGVGSAFDITFGLDVTNWGWEDFTFGFAFTF